MLMAILCGSYKTEAAALSKLNLVRKILAHVSQAISHEMKRRMQTDERARTNEKQVMLCLPFRLPLATELLIR
jgi:hypothetical protein